MASSVFLKVSAKNFRKAEDLVQAKCPLRREEAFAIFSGLYERAKRHGEISTESSLKSLERKIRLARLLNQLRQ